jgi:P4 family phage/plasmid primase-like protien
MSIKTLFSEYLKQFKVTKGDDKNLEITNTRIGNTELNIFGGSYHIKDEEYDKFLKMNFKEVIGKKRKEYLTEKQLNSSDCPILIDIDLKYDYGVKNRLHTEKNISDFVSLYLEELQLMFQFDNNTSIPVYVFEKPAVNCVELKKHTKDGIHMIIGLKADHTCQEILRKRVMKNIAEIWGDLPIINSWDDVFDEGVTKGCVNWQLYGSRKPGNEPYQLTYVYNVSKHPDDGELIYKPIDVKSMETEDNIVKLSARYKEHTSLYMNNTFGDEYDSVVESQKNKVSHKHVNAQINSNQIKVTDIIKITNQDELDAYVNNFLEALKPEEFDIREAYTYSMALPQCYYGEGSFTKWIRAGWALCNIDQRLFIVWVALSAKYSKFEFKNIIDLWDRWNAFDKDNKNGLTKRSIMYWVREENPTEFHKVLENSVDFHIDQTLGQFSLDSKAQTRGSGDFDIATVLYHLYKEEYVCASVKGNIWYRYERNKYYEIDSGTTLRKSISQTLRDIYLKKGQRILQLCAKMDGDDEKTKALKKRVEVIVGICERLVKTNDKKNIMIEAKELFYDPTFLEKLDQNPYLICFKNGVIDFQTKEFRNGRPDDYLSKCTNIDYIIVDPIKDAKKVFELKDFMTKLFPCKELHDYMWDHLSSTLIGTCKEQTINMYIGVGQNGKSVLVNLMEQVLGEYKGDVPLSLITQQRTKIGGLAPELVQLKGVRYAVIQEPSKGDRINEGIMKQLTGGDPIQARAPYMTATMTYIPQFKLAVCSNEFMEIKSQDHGTWRRIRVVDFESLFTENPKADTEKKYQYILDKDIKEKFKSWKEVFASMLVAHAFKTGGNVQDCEKVLASSNLYRQSQDSISEFLSTRICKNPHGCLSKIVVADQFREWYNVNYGGKPPTMKDISFQADKLFGPCRDGLWVGVEMKRTHQQEDCPEIET